MRHRCLQFTDYRLLQISGRRKTEDGKPLFQQKGQTLIEVLMTATVGILVVSALTFITIFSLRNANSSKTAAQATKLTQEGIEIVRTGRNRSSAITNNSNFTSWEGNADGTKAFWDYQISGNCDPNCYFKITNTSGVINYLGPGSTIPANAESIPNSIFKRVVILSDDANWSNQKKVTVIVTWNDFSGNHESKLSTILGKKF